MSTNNNNKKPQPGKNNNNNNNNNNNKQKQRPSRRKRLTPAEVQVANRSMVTFGALSPIARGYIRALVDPFDSPPAMVPSFPSLMTRPVKYWAKGTFDTSATAGSLNTGFIAMCPANGSVSDTGFIFVNTAALPTPTVDVTNVANRTIFFSNSEYATAQLGQNGIQVRIVAAGLRVRNVTPNLTKGGQLIGLAEPAHASLSDYSFANIDLYQESARHGGKDLNDWIQLIWRPVDTDDADFITALPGFNVINGLSIVFMPRAPASGVQTYEFEAYGLYEISGKNVTSKIPSLADTTGFEAVTNVVTGSSAIHSPHIRSIGMADAAAQVASVHLSTGMSHSGPMVKSKAKDAAVSGLSGDIKGAAGAIGALGATGLAAALLGMLF